MKIKTAGISFIVGLCLLGAIIVSISSISLSKTDDVQEVWLAFEQDRNDKLKALISLRSEIGYGGMIHRFKNYILRQNKTDAVAIISSLGGAEAAINRYQSLHIGATEERALRTIQQTIELYRDALYTIGYLIQQNKTAEEIDAIVKIDDLPALEALKTLEIETIILENQQHSTQLLLSELRTAMGYGGLIHNFKNYVLRKSPDTYTAIHSQVEVITHLIDTYRSHELSLIEQQALLKILSVTNGYQEKTSIIKAMITEGESAHNIDKVVIMDDQPALDGFKDLQQQIIFFNEQRANKLEQSLEIVQLSNRIIFYGTFASFLLLISLSFWLLSNQIIQPIAKLTKIMTRLASNDLNVIISGIEQDNEIGEMARSVEVFKTNSKLKQTAEKALKTTHDQLEITVQQRTQELKENELRLTSLVETAVDAIITIDEQGIIHSFNAAAMAMFGYPAYDVIGKNVSMLMPSPFKDEHDGYLESYLKTRVKKIIGIGREVAAQRKNGEIFPINLSVSEVKVQNNQHIFTGIIRDITEMKQQQEKLELMAHYDVLTQLPNRTLFADRFTQAVALSKRNKTLLAICFIDLDDFKPVNDQFGHDIGDKLLIKVSERIKQQIREEDTISRQGGDEFVLMLGNFEKVSQCEELLKRIHRSLAQPFVVDHHTLRISASSGMTIYPFDNEDLDTLLRHADHAMYDAKSAGRNQYQLFDFNNEG